MRYKLKTLSLKQKSQLSSSPSSLGTLLTCQGSVYTGSSYMAVTISSFSQSHFWNCRFSPSPRARKEKKPESARLIHKAGSRALCHSGAKLAFMQKHVLQGPKVLSVHPTFCYVGATAKQAVQAVRWLFTSLRHWQCREAPAGSKESRFCLSRQSLVSCPYRQPHTSCPLIPPLHGCW